MKPEKQQGPGHRLLGYCRDALLIAFATGILALLALTSETNRNADSGALDRAEIGSDCDCPC